MSKKLCGVSVVLVLSVQSVSRRLTNCGLESCALRSLHSDAQASSQGICFYTELTLFTTTAAVRLL